MYHFATSIDEPIFVSYLPELGSKTDREEQRILFCINKLDKELKKVEELFEEISLIRSFVFQRLLQKWLEHIMDCQPEEPLQVSIKKYR